jgi:hypothetical protein
VAGRSRDAERAVGDAQVGERFRTSAQSVTRSVAATALAPAVAAARSAGFALLVNPRSFAVARRGWGAPAVRLGERYGAEVIQAGSGDEIGAAVTRLIERPRAAVFVLAGDGTLQALIDRLAALPAQAVRPQLFVLGGGRSNVTAAELRGHNSVLQKLEQALRTWTEGGPFALESRPVLRIEQASAPPRHGFLFAAGLLDFIIRTCHRARAGRGKLLASDAATAVQVVRVLLSGLAGRGPAIDAIEVQAHGREPLSHPARLLLATTLERRQGLFDPFAARGCGPLRVTAVAARGAAFWLRLPRIALGRFGSGMDAAHGYLSGRCESLHLR